MERIKELFSKKMVIVGVLVLVLLVIFIVLSFSGNKYKSLENSMVSAAKILVKNNQVNVSENSYITFNDLGVKDVYDCSVNSGVNIKEENGNYTYDVYLFCDSYNSSLVGKTKGKNITMLGMNPTLTDISIEFKDPGYEPTAYKVGAVSDYKNHPGIYKITYYVYGSSELLETINRFVIVKENLNDVDIPNAPTINLTGSAGVVLKMGSPYVEPGFTANDTVDGDLTTKVKVSNNVNINSEGTYTVVYQVTNSRGLTATKKRTVAVVKDNAPVLLLNGRTNMTLSVGSSYTEPGCVAVDVADGELTNKVKITGNVNTRIAGEYSVIYKVTNSKGLTTTKVRTVKVIKNEAPVITLRGDQNMTLTVGSTYMEPGFTATDINDGNITAKVITSNNINVGTPGAYTVVYKVTNSRGLTTVVTRNVLVKESGGGSGNNDTTNYKLSVSVKLEPSKVTNQEVRIILTISGDGYLRTELPGVKYDYKNPATYSVGSNGTYTFKICDRNNNCQTKNVTVSNIDKTAPTGNCKVTVNEGMVSYRVTASDESGIKGYSYNTGSGFTEYLTATTFEYMMDPSKAAVIIQDKAGNKNRIYCTIDE